MFKCFYPFRVRFILLVTGYLLFAFFLIPGSRASSAAGIFEYRDVTTGSERVEMYLPFLKNKRIGVVANHTSLIGKTHLIDSLLMLGVNIQKIFTPEHGFRGTADAGEIINTSSDEKTGLPLISLYGGNHKPSDADMADLDLIIYDIQDVGVRFYTYISTMHYVMEACAENGIPLLILDRPNPNGFYVDGPVLDMEYRSFVGMHPVPIVHGMTLAEYAMMINGEGWLEGGLKVDLNYVLCDDYDHNTLYRLPVRPSPNLQTQLSIYLYPSLCLFEGTIMNVGRGTDFPFMVFGHPQFPFTDFQYSPRSTEGATNPLHLGEIVNGVDLRGFDERQIVERKELYLEWLLFAYKNMDRKTPFFHSYFTKLAGNNKIQSLIENGANISAIMNIWQNEVQEFKDIRKKYLLYEDFE